MASPPERERDVEILELGAVQRDAAVGPAPAERGTPAVPRRRPPPRIWVPFALVACLLVGLAAVRVGGDRPARAPGAPTGSATSAARAAVGASAGSASPGSGQSPPSWVTASPAPSPGLVQVTSAGHPLLPGAANWSLFGYSPQGALVQVDPGTGRMVHTAVPTLGGGGPLDLVIGSRSVLIRPWDGPSAVLVPDARPAQTLTDLAVGGGPVVAGPDAEHVWTPSADGRSIVLRTFEGEPRGRPVLLTDGLTLRAGDGTGRLVVTGVGGTYLADERGIDRITAGVLLAAGPTRWLVQECDAHYRCQVVVIDRDDRQRRLLREWSGDRPSWIIGSISPEGHLAALPPQDSNDPTLLLVDLQTGRTTVLPAPASWTYPANVAWSPDGRWLVAPSGPAGEVVVDACTGRWRDLGVHLPTMVAVGVRAVNPGRPAGRFTCPAG